MLTRRPHSLPRELGGSGAGNNPEELFSLGYSACFLSALQLVARNAKEKLPADTAVDALVSAVYRPAPVVIRI